MRIVSRIIALFIQFVFWIFKKTGINGILVIVLLIEIPILCLYYSDSSLDYILDDNYRIQKIVGYDEISIEELPETEKEYASDSYHYFYTTIQIDNYYYNEIRTPDLEAEDSEGDSLTFSQCGYYDDLEANTSYSTHISAVIPSGASANVIYLLGLSDYEIDTLDSITVYNFLDHLDYDSEEEEYETGRRLTAPFVP